MATLTGENGLLSKAQLAKERNVESEQDEKDKLSSYEDEIDNYGTWERTGETGNTVTISEEEYNMLRNDNIYTTDEKIVGKWTNGKPIYRKIINSGTIDMDIDNVVYTDSTIENLITARGVIGKNDMELTIPIVQSGNFLAYFIRDKSNIVLRGGYTSREIWNIVYIMIDYTKKTTDSN